MATHDVLPGFHVELSQQFKQTVCSCQADHSRAHEGLEELFTHLVLASCIHFWSLPFLFSFFWCRPACSALLHKLHQTSKHIKGILSETNWWGASNKHLQEINFSSGEYRFSCFQDTGNGFIWTDEEFKAQGHLDSFPCWGSVPFGQFCPWAAVPSQRRWAYEQSTKLYRAVFTVLLRTSLVLDLSTQLRSFPAIAQMPLGSANDFGNILGWGQLGS